MMLVTSGLPEGATIVSLPLPAVMLSIPDDPVMMKLSVESILAMVEAEGPDALKAVPPEELKALENEILADPAVQEKMAKIQQQIQALDAVDEQMKVSEDGQISLTDPDSRAMATSGPRRTLTMVVP